MASIKILKSPSTQTSQLTVNFTTDVSNITNVELSKDGETYISAISYTSILATFDVSHWENGVYNNCTLRVTYKDSLD